MGFGATRDPEEGAVQTARMTARIVLSDHLPLEHLLKRLQWLWAHPGERTAEDERWFWRRVAAIDAGFPVRRSEVDAWNDAFPALLEIAPTAEALPATTDALCAICRRCPAVDPVRVVRCQHQYCYLCLAEWARVVEVLTCPLCRAVVPRQPSSVQRLWAPPQWPAVPSIAGARPPRLDEVLVDRVRDRMLAEFLARPGPMLVVSEWTRQTEQRWRPSVAPPSRVVFCSLDQARTAYAADPAWQRLVVVDATNPLAAVTAFFHDFPHVSQRLYLATRGSRDHFYLERCHASSAEDDKPLAPATLSEYADFLAHEVVATGR